MPNLINRSHLLDEFKKVKRIKPTGI